MTVIAKQPSTIGRGRLLLSIECKVFLFLPIWGEYVNVEKSGIALHIFHNFENQVLLIFG